MIVNIIALGDRAFLYCAGYFVVPVDTIQSIKLDVPDPAAASGGVGVTMPGTGPARAPGAGVMITTTTLCKCFYGDDAADLRTFFTHRKGMS